MRRRAPSVSSVGEPISIVTNVFLPHSCSPSPTRVTDMHKVMSCWPEGREGCFFLLLYKSRVYDRVGHFHASCIYVHIISITSLIH